MRADEPTRVTVSGSGLDLAVLVWEAQDSSDTGDTSDTGDSIDAALAVDTLLLLHGYLDCGGTFAPFVRELPAGLRILAPDMRGHGASEGVHRGSWYHFEEYVRDVRAVVDALSEGRLGVLGHSMGGGISTLFAGTWPEEVVRLVIVEGLGPPAEDLASGPERMKRWVRELTAEPKASRTFGSMDEVASRLQRQNPGLTPERAEELAGWLAVEDGDAVRWRHDVWHRARSPQIYRPERYAPFLEAVACPTLTVTGGRSWYRWDDLDERRNRLTERRHVHFEDCGHMVHYERPAELAAEVVRHLRS